VVLGVEPAVVGTAEAGVRAKFDHRSYPSRWLRAASDMAVAAIRKNPDKAVKMFENFE
jgi:hypothetical protein